MSLVYVSASDAREFVARWHYSGSAISGTLRYGWEIDGKLMGATIYDNGVHAMRQGVFGPEYYSHVLHHHRLALHPDAPKMSASQFIGASLRQVAKDRPATWAIVTYADECEGHFGGIYQATNALYTGVSAKGNIKYRTPNGVLVTTQTLARYGNWPQRRAAAAELGYTEIRCKGKHRYVYLLGTPKQRRSRPPVLWPLFPYPEKA